MAKSAQDAYLQAHDDANALLMDIQSALFDLPAPDSDIPINWEHVGTASAVKSKLAEIMEFLGSGS